MHIYTRTRTRVRARAHSHTHACSAILDVEQRARLDGLLKARPAGSWAGGTGGPLSLAPGEGPDGGAAAGRKHVFVLGFPGDSLSVTLSLSPPAPLSLSHTHKHTLALALALSLSLSSEECLFIGLFGLKG